MEWLKDLKIGDKVLIHIWMGKYPLIKKVERITKTLIITDNGSRFNKRDGRIPGDGYTKSSISQWSQEKENIIKIKIAKINYVHKFKNFNWVSLSIDDLRKVNSIIPETK